LGVDIKTVFNQRRDNTPLRHEFNYSKIAANLNAHDQKILRELKNIPANATVT